jgi:broad specificity phosphatase PhoE
MTPLLYFVRHGQTEWNAQHRLQGQSDTDLNETGRAQADANGLKLAKLIGDASQFDFVASPMRRTRETMERVRKGMGLEPQDYRTDARLVEVHFGDWQGFTYAELEARFPEVTRKRERDKWNIVPPGEGAESYQMLLERVRPWFEALSEPTVCVAHGGVARVIFRLAAGLDGMQASRLEIPQDKILRLKDGRAEWL